MDADDCSNESFVVDPWCQSVEEQRHDTGNYKILAFVHGFTCSVSRFKISFLVMYKRLTRIMALQVKNLLRQL